MLFILFYVGDDRYVVEAQKVVEVVPFVKLTKFPNTADYIAGLCNYRAVPVPVVDVRCLIVGEISRQVMSTRILLVKYLSHTSHEHILGMIVEYATETITLEIDRFHQSSLSASKGSYVSKVMTDEHGIIQWLDADQLLSHSDCDFLYGSQLEALQ